VWTEWREEEVRLEYRLHLERIGELEDYSCVGNLLKTFVKAEVVKGGESQEGRRRIQEWSIAGPEMTSFLAVQTLPVYEQAAVAYRVFRPSSFLPPKSD